jgi:glycerophosphoryl diester phosphodiesterase
VAAHGLARPAPQAAWFVQFQGRGPLVIAHSDDAGLGPYPGDSLLYFERMTELGVDVLEMNVHTSADGQVVLIHDDTVDRTTNGTGRVNDLTVAELQALDAAYRYSQDGGRTFPFREQGVFIPTLDQVFEQYPDMPMVIEIKQETPSLADPLCATIRRHAMQARVIIPASSDKAISEFRQACPEVATAASTSEVTALTLLNLIGLGGTVSPDFSALQVPVTSRGIPIVTASFVRTAHARGLDVHVWTINDQAEMEELLAQGVDGIMTDRPEVLLRLLGR